MAAKKTMQPIPPLVVMRIDANRQEVNPMKQVRIKQVMLTLIVALLLAACGGAAVTPETPPEIVYGEDVCNHCGMIISDERFAAGVVVETRPQHYEHRIFDDIGDMFAYAQELEESATEESATEEIVTYYVHDYTSREWLDARQATFVQGEPSSTPMGSGLAAFADATAAAAHADEVQGEVIDFATLFDLAPASHSHAMH